MDNQLFTDRLVDSQRVLYTPSSFAKTSLLHLQEVGSLRALSAHTSRRENLSSYLFFMVEQGSGELVYEGISYQIGTGDCVFIDCHKAYSHSTNERDLWKIKWVHFFGPGINAIYEMYVQHGGHPHFNTERSEVYQQLLCELYDLAGDTDYIRDMRINTKLSMLLTYLMEESSHADTFYMGTKQRSLQDMKEYIERHYNEKISLDYLASAFFINKFYLTRIFKERFGLSVNNYILRMRITHAKSLLRFTDMTVDQIAAECGMNDANYFSRMFKKIEEITPGEFRKIWNN